MSLHFRVLAALLVIGAWVTVLPDGARASEIHADYIGSPVVIDGVLSDRAWASAMEVGFVDPGGVSDNRVAVKILWDDRSLFIGYRVVDGSLETGGSRPYHNDGIEFYLDTDRDRSTSGRTDDFHVAIDLSGSTLFRRQDGRDLGGVATLEHAATSAAGAFTMEVRLEWADLGVTPSPGRAMGLLLANNDRDGGATRQFDWMDVRPFDQPSLWGVLQLEGGTGPVPDAGPVTTDAGPLPRDVDAGSPPPVDAGSPPPVDAGSPPVRDAGPSYVYEDSGGGATPDAGSPVYDAAHPGAPDGAAEGAALASGAPPGLSVGGSGPCSAGGSPAPNFGLWILVVVVGVVVRRRRPKG